MRSLVLYEHGVLRAVSDDRGWTSSGTPWSRDVPRRWFDRLHRLDDLRGAQRVFDWGYDRAKATQFVGVIQLDGVSLEILPKVERIAGDTDDGSIGAVRRNLLWFLMRAGEVPCRERDLAALQTRRAPLLDALTALFASRLWDELLRGVARSYVTREENLRRLRGKLVVPQQIARNAVHRERFVCRHDEFSEDTPLNQVLRAAAEVLVRRAALASARQTLARCLEVLDGVTALSPDRAALVARRVVLDRQTERYATLFAFARMVLESRNPEVIAGETSTFSLLFDMNKVFEGLVTDLLERAVRQHHPLWTAHAQGKPHTRHLYEGDASPKNLLELKPDVLLVGPSGAFVVVDAKWKRLTLGAKGHGPVRDDLYQMHGYSVRYDADVLVLHPRGGDVAVDERTWHALDHVDQRRRAVHYATLDVSRDFSTRVAVGLLEDEVLACLSKAMPKAPVAQAAQAVTSP